MAFKCSCRKDPFSHRQNLLHHVVAAYCKECGKNYEGSAKELELEKYLNSVKNKQQFKNFKKYHNYSDSNHPISLKLRILPQNSPTLNIQPPKVNIQQITVNTQQQQQQLNVQSTIDTSIYIPPPPQEFSDKVIIEIQKRGDFYTRECVSQHRECIYVYSDNQYDIENNTTFPGRSSACLRGLPNAVGIPTRLVADNEYKDTSGEFDGFKQILNQQIEKILNSKTSKIIFYETISNARFPDAFSKYMCKQLYDNFGLICDINKYGCIYVQSIDRK